MKASPFLPADWPAPGNVHGFSTLRRGLGVSRSPFDEFNLGGRYAEAGDAPEAIASNRRLLIERAGLPSPPHWLRQVHGAGVVRFDRQACEASEEAEADASVTSERGVVLAVLTADCLPVLFCSAHGDEVGAAHAGWRGLAGGVLEATVGAMRAPARNVLAWLGPAAGPLAYEVGEEVRSAFVSHDPEAASAFVATRPGHWRVDLYALARQRLQSIGLQRIHGGGLCTISDAQHFFSHRRDQRAGRMASLVWMQ